MRKLLSCAIALAAAGCASSTTMPVAQDIVVISSQAAPVCGSVGAQKVAIKQAAVETIRRGYDRYLIVGGEYRNDVGVVGYTPVMAHTTGSVYGNNISATTTYSGGEPIIAGSHRQGLVVKMFRDNDPAGANALSARTELGPKWAEIVKSETVTCFD